MPAMTMNGMSQILNHFSLPGTLLEAGPFGSGLINDTYLAVFKQGEKVRKYIVQRINANVFRQPVQVMENVAIVTSHIMDRLRAAGIADPASQAPALVPARDGSSFFRDPDGAFWRVFHFIESGVVFDRVVDAKHAYEVGRGLGTFQALVSDLAPGKLHDTLPGFHDTPRYLMEYDDALNADARGRAGEINSESAFINRRRHLAPLLTQLMESGALPIRIVHNDPKVNNVMVRSDTREALCMLDLDTVKPGIVHFDFGDCVRSASNAAGEDAGLKDVSFHLEFFRAVAGGYLREAGGFLTAKEREMLPASVRVITFELGIRFLADYLRGDTYFRIQSPEHNLHRARVQFTLLESIEAAEEQMVAFISRL